MNKILLKQFLDVKRRLVENKSIIIVAPYFTEERLKDGYYKVKFKCNIKFPGNKSGFFLVKVDLKDMSPDTKIKTDKNGQSYEEKLLWINDIIGIKEDTEYYALLREKKEQELLKLLDDSLKF